MQKYMLLSAIIFSLSFSFITPQLEKIVKPIAPETPITESEVVTEGQVILPTGNIPYKATTGIYHYKNKEGVVKGRFFYVAYTRTDIQETTKRPVAFCFNGGPGSSSVWLHMGLLGPKRVVLKDRASNVPPYQFTNNEYTLLDSTDLVFIDPISTGYSRPTDLNSKKFYNVDDDIQSIGEFIRLYTTRNVRWESPKFLIGESYGTLRAVELASHLYDVHNLSTNGAILISSLLDFETIGMVDRGNDLSYLLFLPSYAATAWFHHRMPEEMQKLDLETVLAQVKKYALEEYSVILLKGDKLLPEQRIKAVEMLSKFTGLSKEYIERVNLRIKPLNYAQELMRNEEKIVGRFDSRITGYLINKNTNFMEYDPSLDQVFSAFAATFHEYVRTHLKWIQDDPYNFLVDLPWSFGKAGNRYFSAVSTLRELLLRVPSYSVFVASGYYDLATPFFGTSYTFDHLNLNEKRASQITQKHYPAGHMMYTSQQALVDLSRDMHIYIQKAITQD